MWHQFEKVAHGSNDQFKSPPSLLVYFTLVITSSTAFGVLTAATLSSPDVDRVPETGSLLLLKASLASTASVLEEDVVGGLCQYTYWHRKH